MKRIPQFEEPDIVNFFMSSLIKTQLTDDTNPSNVSLIHWLQERYSQ